MKDALGLVEVAGLATAIQVADAMVKSANVTIIDIEKAKGSGWMTVKVHGDVGAVQAAVQAGSAQAEQFGHLIAQKVIPRPAEGLDTWLLAGGGEAVLQSVSPKVTEVKTAVPKSTTQKTITATATVATKVVQEGAKPEQVAPAKAVATKPVKKEATKADAVKTAGAKTDVGATSEADATKSALLEVFKPGSTERQANTGTKAPSSAAKGSPKKRPSRAKNTKPKA